MQKVTAYTKILHTLFYPFRTQRKVHTYNPRRTLTLDPESASAYTWYVYNEAKVEQGTATAPTETMRPVVGNNIWINIDGLRKQEVEAICERFGVHFLLKEDVLSVGQRAKSDDMEDHLFCILPMLTYNSDTGVVQLEQISLVLGKRFLLSFQADPHHDPFNPIRAKLKDAQMTVRKKETDYLTYLLIDAIVDDYFIVLEKLSERLEKLEDETVSNPNKSILYRIMILKHELMVVKRAITPVREVVSFFTHTDNALVDDANNKFFKDVYDHITIAIEYTDSYREMAMNLQDLYMNQLNARMNEVMKILTVVTTLLVPATVISGVFGMNFARIPFSDNPNGFWYALGCMLLIALLMVFYFKRKRWF